MAIISTKYARQHATPALNQNGMLFGFIKAIKVITWNKIGKVETEAVSPVAKFPATGKEECPRMDLKV
jgi:hypothetical protein